jgi:hypothetical protein
MFYATNSYLCANPHRRLNSAGIAQLLNCLFDLSGPFVTPCSLAALDRLH